MGTGGDQDHYEIHVLKGPSWAFFATAPDREEAVDAALPMVGRDGVLAVKVVRESFDPVSSSFKSRTVLLEGRQDAISKAKPLPNREDSRFCFKVDDFYSLYGRQQIAILLRQELDRWVITPTELLHVPDHVDRLQATGTVLQHVVQKTAIMQVQQTKRPVTERAKELYDLIGQAERRLFTDKKHKRLPILEKGGTAALLETIDAEQNRLYLLNCAVCGYLAPLKTWRSKLEAMMALLDEPGVTAGPRRFLLQVIDVITGELLSSSVALTELVGASPDLATQLGAVADLYLGRFAAADALPAVRMLNQLVGEGQMISARTALARRVLGEIATTRPLTKGNLAAEIAALGTLYRRFDHVEGTLVQLDEIREAFRGRSERQLGSGVVSDYLAATPSSLDRAEKLLALEANVIGLGNKRRLAGFVGPLLTGPDAQGEVVVHEGHPMDMLRRLVAMQQVVLASQLDDQDKDKLSGRLDQLNLLLFERSGILPRAERSAGGPIDRAITILRLCTAGILTQGQSRERAQRRALALITREGLIAFMTGADEAERTARRAILRNLLQDAGLENVF
ncbi:hypothetical protein [Zavarzinia sp. CC-PAN008]|uniref:hypothetical protein n=1 Tax=Zavarzinia sp. CC-PAN008 TaxID=3243332 RepID=UPI003F74A2C9